ncbi:MAG: acyl-[acyl-carrier-protein]--UDP-N-acetylglucosamine O-acyltransferase, partial [Desulfuromonas sp.]
LVGLKRRGFSDTELSAIKKAYRVLFRSGKRQEEALSELEAWEEIPASVRLLIDFVRLSERGIVRS